MKDHSPYIESMVSVNAPASRVWEILVSPDAIRQWGAEFSEGTWVESNWHLGSDLIWMTKEGEVGAHGVITVFEPGSHLEVDYYDDVESGPPKPPDEYSESYFLEEQNGVTKFSFKAGPLPVQVIISHTPLWDAALAKIKSLAEK